MVQLCSWVRRRSYNRILPWLRLQTARKSAQLGANLATCGMFFRPLRPALCLSAITLATLPAFSQLTNKNSANPAEPDELTRHYQAARTFEVAGDQDRAAVEYRAFLGQALRQLANFRANQGNYQDASRLFEEAVALTSDSAALRLDYGSFLLLSDDSAKARTQLEKAVELEPKNRKAQYLLGRAFFEQGDYQKAKEHLEAAAKASGGELTFDVGYDLSITYLKLKDVNRASLLFDEMLVGFGNTASLHLYFGHAYLMTEQYDRAISEFKQAIQKDAKIKEAHYFLGLAYLARDEGNGWDENAAEDRAEIQNNPDDFRPHYDLGNIDLKLHRVEEAERELKRASELQPENPDPLVLLGELFVSQRRLPEAEDAMTRAISLTKDPSRNQYQVSRAYYVLGRIQMETGRREQGAKTLAVAADLRERSQAPASRDSPTASAQARLAGEVSAPREPPVRKLPPDEKKQLENYFDQLKPAIADAYNNLGVAAGAHNDFAQAVVYFRKAGEWYPALETLERNLGMAAFHAADYQTAIQPLYHVLERNPDDERARVALGLSYFAVENYPATAETFRPMETTVARDPGTGAAYAVALIKVGQYDKGMSLLKALEQASPGVAGLHVTIAEVYADQGIYASAIDEYKRALALDPGQPRARYLLGVALLRDGQPADAVHEFRAAVEQDPLNLAAKYHLALALLEAQQKEEALPLLEQVINQDPKYADAYYELGKAQLESGEAKRAISNLEQAANLSPASDYVHYQLSLAYRREGRADDAKREIELYQRLKAEHRGSHEQPQSN